MSRISVKTATTISELRDAARIRCSVFADEFAYLDPNDFPAGCEVDGFDLLPTTITFLGLVDGEPAATVRLLFPNTAVAARCKTKLGLSIEHTLELLRIRDDMVLADIPRSSVLKPYRRTGIMRHLYRAAYEESIRRGATHWLGLANTETDCEADARTVHQLLKVHGMRTSDFDAKCHNPGEPPAIPRYPLYSPEQRERVRNGNIAGAALPRTLVLFADKYGTRYVGSPFFDGDFRMFAMPHILRLQDFAASPYGSTADVA